MAMSRISWCAPSKQFRKGKNGLPQVVFEEFLAYRGALQSEEDPVREGRGIFTPREKLVIGLLERRLGKKEISQILGISESTVKFHLSNIFRKLGARDRLSAAEAASPLLLTPCRQVLR